MSRQVAAAPESFTSFGDLLKYLRRRAQLTQRDLSIAVGYSEPQISYLETNRRLPDVATVAARFVPALELDDEPELARRLIVLAEAARVEAEPAPGAPPFKGLLHFEEADAGLFFGREDLAQRIVQAVIAVSRIPAGAGSRFLAVVGASGSGKSSVLRAGLLPGLRRCAETAGWPIPIITPTAHPMASLGQAQDARLLIVDQFEELFTLCADEAERQAFLDELLAGANALESKQNPERIPKTVVIGLRADFYAECSQYANLREALSQHQVYIGPMNADELRRAIEEPAKAGRWEFEPGLVDLLLRDTGEEPGALPLLSHALLETWLRRRGRVMTLSGYLSSGGVRGAIAETAESLLNDEFDPRQRAVARNIFLRLTELGEGTQAARRRAALAELTLHPGDEFQVQPVLDRLIKARLLTTSEATVEIAHEALIREWPTLRQWLLEDRESILLHRQLASAAQAWERGGRSLDELYRGARLARALEWAATHAAELNLVERAFLDAARQQAEHDAAERERQIAVAQQLAEVERQRAAEAQAAAQKLRRRARALVGALALVIGLLAMAFYLGAQARQSESAARRSAQDAQAASRIATGRELAAAATGNLALDPERSILLGLQAISVTSGTSGTATQEAVEALHRALQASRVQKTLTGHTQGVWSVSLNPDGTMLATVSQDGTAKLWPLGASSDTRPLLSLPTGVTSNYYNGIGAAFTPDGKRVLAAAANNTAQLWDVASGERLLTLTGHKDGVSALAVSPDGTRFATGSLDNTAKLWDAATGKELLTLAGHKARVNVIFSPDSKRVYTGSWDGTAAAWDVATGRRELTFQAPVSEISGLAISPDGKRLAAGSFDTATRIYDTGSGALLQTLYGHSSLVVGVAFSPDGTRLASASEDGTVRLWDALTGKDLLTLAGHTSGVLGVVFSADNGRLITGSRDATVRVWDISPNGGREWLNLAGHADRVHRVAFGPDGARLATWSFDGKVRIWDASSGNLLHTLSYGLLTGQGGIAYSPDGKYLAGGGPASTVRIWDAVTGQELRDIPGAGHPVSDVAFSRDGKRLAAGTISGTLTIYRVDTWQNVLTYQAHAAVVGQLAFSPDGGRLATASEDKSAALWELSETGAAGALAARQVLSFKDFNGSALGIAYSPDGRRIAASIGDGTVQVWDAASGKRLYALTGHTGSTFGVAFSPDGRRIASASVDRTVKVWDLPPDGGPVAPPLTLYGHTAAIYRVVFSPDGTRLATASRDGTSRIYALQTESLIALARQRLTRSWRLDECQQFLHVPNCP